MKSLKQTINEAFVTEGDETGDKFVAKTKLGKLILDVTPEGGETRKGRWMFNGDYSPITSASGWVREKMYKWERSTNTIYKYSISNYEGDDKEIIAAFKEIQSRCKVLDTTVHSNGSPSAYLKLDKKEFCVTLETHPRKNKKYITTWSTKE